MLVRSLALGLSETKSDSFGNANRRGLFPIRIQTKLRRRVRKAPNSFFRRHRGLQTELGQADFDDGADAIVLIGHAIIEDIANTRIADFAVMVGVIDVTRFSGARGFRPI